MPDLADSGFDVHIVEKEPSIGGKMAQIDKTFPTMDCSICILAPKMSEAGGHPNITLHTHSEVLGIEGYIGNFKAKIVHKARYVTNDCTSCGDCSEVCEQLAPNEFDIGLATRKAVYIPFAQAIPFKAVIDPDSCLQLTKGKCNQKCVEVCGPEAIDFEMEETYVDLQVGAIVVATGFSMWDPTQLSQYAYGESPNVMTGMEFERLSNAGGITGGEIKLADGRTPERVAVIHCVGSRDHNAHEYCSRICCMYSLKQAHLVKDKTGADVYEFYMDMRAFGKEYEEFYERIQEEGVAMIRGRGAEVEVLEPEEGQEHGKLRVSGEDANLGRQVYVDVDMVVLSTAIEAPHDAEQVGSIFGLGRTQDGWFAESHPKMRPVETNTEGVYLAGCAQGPRDVPDTVAHAGAAASMALSLLGKGEVTISPATAIVDEDLCSACKTCISLCPYTAISFLDDKNVAYINEALCKGCGTCVAACPAGAITGRHFTTEQIMAQIEGLFRLPEKVEVEEVEA